MDDDTTSAQGFAEMLPRIGNFASGLSDKDRELFDKMMAGAAEAIMSGFQAYSADFGAAFRAGKAQLTISYDDATLDAPGAVGKYSTRYVKP